MVLLLSVKQRVYFGVLVQLVNIKLYKKYLADDQVFFFLFGDANKPLIWSKKRCDGSKSTHAEWCVRNGFLWYDLKSKLMPEDFNEIRRDYELINAS